MNTTTTLNELPDDIRDWSRQNFVDNECGSDEYRETQPAKGLGMISEMFEIFEAGEPQILNRPPLNRQFDMSLFGGTAEIQALQEVRDWLDAIITTVNDPAAKGWEKSYAGADELAIVLARYHDMAWAYNSHPYDYTAEEIRADYDEDHREEVN